MAGNNSRVYTGEVSIGATPDGKARLLMAAGHSEYQARSILERRDGLSMPIGSAAEMNVVDAPLNNTGAPAVPRPPMTGMYEKSSTYIGYGTRKD